MLQIVSKPLGFPDPLNEQRGSKVLSWKQQSAHMSADHQLPSNNNTSTYTDLTNPLLQFDCSKRLISLTCCCPTRLYQCSKEQGVAMRTH